MELLLVSPLRERQIIRGRLCGIWSQFLPGFLALAVLWGYLAFAIETSSTRLWYFGTTFLALPVFGLYCSLKFRHFVVALLCAASLVVVGPLGGEALIEWVVPPFMQADTINYLRGNYQPPSPPETLLRLVQTAFVVLPMLLELALALLLLWRLERILKQRRFVSA